MRPYPRLPALAASLVLPLALALACADARRTEAGVPDHQRCVECHGGAENGTGAPPRDVRGSTDPALASVGAHSAHVVGGPLAGAFDCDACHPKPVEVSSPPHFNGTVELAFGPLATAGGTLQPRLGADGRCSDVYCHGASLQAGGTNQAPRWTGGAGEAACGTCHGAPPPFPHPPNPDCGGCHGDGYAADAVNPATHVNGALELGAVTCTMCHGDRAATASPEDPRHAAPPLDAHGAAASPRVGAHPVHLDGSALAAPLPCTSCHAVPAGLLGHPSGATELAWSPLARGAATAAANTNPAFSGFVVSTPTYAGGACSNVYCHGSYEGTFTFWPAGLDPSTDPSMTVTYRGRAATVAWNGSAPCGSCHAIPGLASDAPPAGAWHGGTHGRAGALDDDCATCHPDATGVGASAAILPEQRALHADGKVDLAPRFVSACFTCH